MYISVRRMRCNCCVEALLRNQGGGVAAALSEHTADEALKRAWALWGSHIPAFIRPEARP